MMRNFITIIEGAQYGWQETEWEVFTHMFSATNHETWLEHDEHYSGIEGLHKFFVWWENGEPAVFAAASTEESYGEVFGNGGSDHRYIQSTLIAENEVCAAYIYWEATKAGDYTVAVDGLADQLKGEFTAAVTRIEQEVEALDD